MFLAGSHEEAQQDDRQDHSDNLEQDEQRIAAPGIGSDGPETEQREANYRQRGVGFG